MKDYLLSRINNALWTLIVVSLVSLAAYASFGRLIVENVERYQDDLLRELNARLDFVVEVENLRGSWSSFTPRIEFTGLRLVAGDHVAASLKIDQAYAEVDVLDTLLSGSIQFFALVSSGVQAHLDVDADGQLSLSGFPAAGGGGFASPLYDFVFNSERLGFKDVSLVIHEGTEIHSVFVEAELLRDQEFRRLSMSLLSPSRESWFNFQAEGYGDLLDFSEFNGVLHMETHVGQLAAYSKLLSPLGISVAQGVTDAEMWMELDDGRAEVAAKFGGTNIELSRLTEPDRSYAADAFKATLRADYQDDHWNFAMQDLSLQGKGEDLQLAGVTGVYADSDLSLRTGDIDIERLVRFLQRARFLDEASEQLLAELAPAGHMDRLQFAFADRDNWTLDANFRALSVASWQGAPGVKNASGYLSMGPREGRVQLASSDFSMEFPTVYREALNYQDFNAELAWKVEEDVFRIYSGPFTGRDDEGVVRGLFGLRIPLEQTEAGIEMDLLVGLADTHPVQRNKYLPFTLSQGLLDWLRPSIGEGNIQEGGFLWRGSLGRPDLRTVILFFQIENTRLDYHPAWPPLDDVQGLVMIDGADVDARVQRARILDSQVRDVTVSLRTDERDHLMLAVSAEMAGSASDGLQIVNQSALRTQIGDSFASWTLQGGLQTRLDLLLDLTAQPIDAQVKVEVDWDEVQIDTGSLGLVVEGVNGSLLFDTGNGFSSRDLHGKLWGQPVQAEISQGPAQEGLAELDVALFSRVEVESLRQWLQLGMLDWAQGAAAAEMHIKVPPGGQARVELTSDLQGVALDLPQPWAKPAALSRSLHAAMPLAGAQRRLVLDIDEQLHLGVLMGEQGFVGGSLGFGALLPAEEAGRFLLGGSVDTLNWNAWSEFVESYVLGGQERKPASPAAALLFGVRALDIHQLEVLGQQLEDVRLNAAQNPDSWEVAADLGWLRGSASLPADFSSIAIAIDSLDLEGVSSDLLQGFDTGNAELMNLPPMQVTVAELSSGEHLWGDLSFDLAEQPGLYSFSDIRGHIRGLQLGDTDAGMRLDWQYGDQPAQTHLNGRLLIEDLGDVLADFNYDRVIETESGAFDIELDWPGSPLDFSLAAAGGEIDIDIGEGSFLKTSGATSGTLRVVSILNLADFVRRLSLDLSYMFQSGVPFDSIEGVLESQRGVINIPGLDVSGRSSTFQFVGSANVAEETLNMDLVATLPIASNLPWVAALISGLPAAAAVYVISKLFTKQMDRFSSAVYHIEGPWDDPVVKFQSIFDDSATTVIEPPAEAVEPSAVKTEPSAETIEPSAETIEPSAVKTEPSVAD